MSYEECVRILEAYERQTRPQLTSESNEIGYRVKPTPSARGFEFVLERIVRSVEAEAGEDPKLFSIDFESQTRVIQPQVVPGEIPTMLGQNSQGPAGSLATSFVRGGDRCHGDRIGTIGWFFYLNNQLVGISNRHVMGVKVGDPIYAGPNSAPGKIHFLEDFSFKKSVINRWDLALATPDDPNLVQAQMADSSVTYPTGIADDPQVADNSTFVCVGYGSQGATIPGSLTSVRTGLVHPDIGGKTVTFKNQLEFDTVTQDGDSGSVMIRQDDHFVAGLVFASYPTLANPLYLMGWSLDPAGPYNGFPSFIEPLDG